MRAIQLEQYGPPENLKLVNIPMPEPKQGEVLIKVEAASVIFADSMVRRGAYINRSAELPFIPGREVAGTVKQVNFPAQSDGDPSFAEKTGARMTGIKPGMRVAAFLLAGGHAEYAVAPLKDVVCLPDRVSFLQGLVYQHNMRIAFLAYYTFGQIQPNDTILLHAPAGGIGTLITHIAKRRARNVIIAVSSSPEKIAYCLENGADYGINYKTTNYVEEVLRITGGKGVDVSLNSVAGPTLETDPYAIKNLGRWVLYGGAAGYGKIDQFDVVTPKSQTVSFFSVYTVREREEYRQANEFMLHWLHTEELLSVSKTFALEEIADAHHLIDTQQSIGKIAIIM